MRFRSLLVVAVVAGFAAGCASRPYEDVVGPDTARVRFVTRGAAATSTRVYDSDQCTNALAMGTLRDGIILKQPQQKLGMAGAEDLSAYQYTERRFVAGRPIIGKMQSSKMMGRYYQRCGRMFSFVPGAGRDYEVMFDDAPDPCTVVVAELLPNPGGAPARLEMPEAAFPFTPACRKAFSQND